LKTGRHSALTIQQSVLLRAARSSNNACSTNSARSLALFEVSLEDKEASVEHKKEAFDAHGFLDLLGEVMDHDVTGVLNVRIHVRDGIAWAVSVQFNDAAKRAA